MLALFVSVNFLLPGLYGEPGKSHAGVNQQILNVGGLFGFSAYPFDCTACVFCCFLTLVAKHTHDNNVLWLMYN